MVPVLAEDLLDALPQRLLELSGDLGPLLFKLCVDSPHFVVQIRQRLLLLGGMLAR
jgi:hypothetical protein